MKKDFKTKFELLLIKMLCFNPRVEGDLGGCLFDTHHAAYDVFLEGNIMASVFSSNLSKEDLRRIDSMFVEEKNIYDRLNEFDAFRMKTINRLLKDISKSGYSIKNVNFPYSDTLFEYGYFMRQSEFNLLCGKYPNLSFKTKKHYDEENDPMFNGCFLAGIYTPLGVVTYHLKLKYFDGFNAPEIERGPKYDNYDIQEGLYRLASLADEELVRKHLESKNNKSLGLRR